ncbi:MAG: hypothetical protein JST89_00055 [Cyanobacteria bacterium SZAS-4]|nr:hypothetical protein [Cyanobacteria bacterium SZAS-4]
MKQLCHFPPHDIGTELRRLTTSFGCTPVQVSVAKRFVADNFHQLRRCMDDAAVIVFDGESWTEDKTGKLFNNALSQFVSAAPEMQNESIWSKNMVGLIAGLWLTSHHIGPSCIYDDMFGTEAMKHCKACHRRLHHRFENHR